MLDLDLLRCRAAVRGFWRVMVASVLALMMGRCVLAQASKGQDYCSILGTQLIGGKYQFSADPMLLEGAREVLEMGLTVYKFALPAKHAFASLAQHVAQDQVTRQVLDLPLSQYLLWVNAQSEGAWSHGLKPEQVLREYRHVYELTAHLLKAYRGSGKSFYLGHWEGDNMLRGGINKSSDAKMEDAVRVQGFIDWLRIRQQAVDDAKRDIPPEGVQVWHYTEVNHPTISLLEKRPSIANKVLPKVAVDFVSYSAYDSQHDADLLRRTLDYLQAQLKPKPGLPARRVFIGEYGFWTWKDGRVQNTPAQQDEKSRQVIRAALQWGCPFILYWQLYNNELDADGRQRGFWMIDDKGLRQPIYHTHRDFAQWVRGEVSRLRSSGVSAPFGAELLQAAQKYFLR